MGDGLKSLLGLAAVGVLGFMLYSCGANVVDHLDRRNGGTGDTAGTVAGVDCSAEPDRGDTATEFQTWVDWQYACNPDMERGKWMDDVYGPDAPDGGVGPDGRTYDCPAGARTC